jgi:mannose-6-phosphate isomerase-like protein (cupin superfamily)
LVSRILLQEGDVPGAGFKSRWAEVTPGSRRRLHDHGAEQVYVILRDGGKMRVGEEKRRVEEGDLVYVPPGALHGIENATEGAPVCVSAATPALNAEAAYDTGRLRERPGGRKGARRAHG